VPSVIDQRADELQQRLVFGTVGRPRNLPMRVAQLSARTDVQLVFDSRHFLRRVARQQQGNAIAAFVENSFDRTDLIEPAMFGS
jgi:hypothetical protein